MKSTFADLPLRENQTRRLREVLLLALRNLASRSSLPVLEDEINRELYFAIRDANATLHNSGNGGFECFPLYEAPNQPSSEDTCASGRERKTPDFSLGLVDASEPDESKASYVHAIECKRLALKIPNSTFDLVGHYVDHGISRFIDPAFGYGTDSDVGTMIGYVQQGDLGVLSDRVNKRLSSRKITQLTLGAAGWIQDQVSELGHEFVRSMPRSPFSLLHLWCDLRKIFGFDPAPAAAS